MNRNGCNVESPLWDAADELRANSVLKSSEYSTPVLGLVFLRYADHKFQAMIVAHKCRQPQCRGVLPAKNNSRVPTRL